MYTKISDFLNENNNIYLGKLNVEDLEKNMIRDGFGTLKDHIEAGGGDLTISKSLYLNGKVIGGYLLCKFDMLKSIDGCIDNENKGIYKKLKFFVNKDFLNKYKGKIGIFSDYIYIQDEYRNKNYAKYLIDYSKSLGDYVWGGSLPNKTSEYWLEKQNRIKIFQMEVDGNIELFTATNPNK